MKYLRLLFIAMLIAQASYAQRVYVGMFGGVAAYSGDLTSKIYPKKVTNGAIGFNISVESSARLTIKTGLNYSVIGGADRYEDDPSRVIRNLSFETSIVELNTVGEYYLLDMEKSGFTPYVFGGAAIFKFNPYAYDANGQKVFLRPLSTEGQGLSQYPDRKPYHLTQFAIPFGGGIKVSLNDQVRVGFELGMRKLFTEYLDDVSTNYVNWEILAEERGPVAVAMSYRGGELDASFGNSLLPYPGEGTQRGDPRKKDGYYFTGIQLSYLFKDGSDDQYGRAGKRRGRLGCPSNVY